MARPIKETPILTANGRLYEPQIYKSSEFMTMRIIKSSNRNKGMNDVLSFEGLLFFLLYFHSTFGQIRKRLYFCTDSFRHASHRTANQGGTFAFIDL